MRKTTWRTDARVVIKNRRHRGKISFGWLFILLLLIAAGLGCGAGSSCGGETPQSSAEDAGRWLRGGSDLHNTRFQGSEKIINSSNVGGLAPKWVETMAGDISATPTTDGTNIYFPDWGGNLNALSASTGEVVWQKVLSSRTSPAIADDGASLFVGTPIFAASPASIVKLDTIRGHSSGTRS